MRHILVITGLLLLSACGPHIYSPEENMQLYKVGKPYKVENKWYRPKEDPYYDKVGMASWYGPGFHGNKTADGEEFDKYDLTAAHRTLPMPCIVKVTNLENGRSANLRVNDRGPFARSRILDVSKHAAEVLGFYGKGTAKVRVQFLPEETATLFGGKMPEGVLAKAYAKPKLPALTPSTISTTYTPPTVSTNRDVVIQVGTFRKRENAESVLNDVSRFGVAKLEEIHQEGERFYRVRVGTFSGEKDPAHVLSLIQESGYDDAQFVRF